MKLKTNLTNMWLKLSDNHWFYVVTDYGKKPSGHVVNCIQYYRPYNTRGAIEIELRIEQSHKFTVNWKPFTPTYKHKRLAIKGVFR